MLLPKQFKVCMLRYFMVFECCSQLARVTAPAAAVILLMLPAVDIVRAAVAHSFLCNCSLPICVNATICQQAELQSSAQQAQEVERTMRQVATLNQMISTAVMHQAEMVEQLYNNAVDATHNLTRGNTELKKTIKVQCMQSSSDLPWAVDNGAESMCCLVLQYLHCTVVMCLYGCTCSWSERAPWCV